MSNNDTNNPSPELLRAIVATEVAGQRVELWVKTTIEAIPTLATTVTIPSFIIPPDVIIWGTRIFIRRLDGRYVEGFVAAAIEETNKRKAVES